MMPDGASKDGARKDGTRKVLTRMLERPFAALANGTSLNSTPHSCRQRVDLSQFARLQDHSPDVMLQDLLGEARTTKVSARVPPFQKKEEAAPGPSQQEDDAQQKYTPEEKAARQAWSEQQALMTKLRTIAEDAKSYENDTGVHVLHIGFPLLSLPPGSFGLQRSFTRRILAPLAFISVSLTV